MRIDRIRINAFGCHRKVDISFTEGINLIYGSNESGKSTLLAFVRAVLYGFDSRASGNPRKKYMPWGSSSESRFGGELFFTCHQLSYKATALFTQSKRTDVITLYNNVTGEIIPIPDGQSIGEYLLGLTATAFDCSVFAAQLKSREDFSKDKSGLLISRLSAASNNTPESSSAEADLRLKEAIQKISSPRKGDGILDRLTSRQAALKDALSHIESREGRVGDLTGDMETLTAREAKLESRRKYYLQFHEIKQAFTALENRQLIQRKQKEILRISDEIESLKEPLEEELYDLPEQYSGLFLFLAFLMIPIFGGALFFSVYAYLCAFPLPAVVGGLAGTVLALCGSIVCFLKRKKTMTLPPMPEEDAQRLHELEILLQKEQTDFDDLVGDASLEELEQRWKNATGIIQTASLNKNTLVSIRQCPAETISEKLEETTSELMDVRNRISYVKACIDTLQDPDDRRTEAEDIITADDAYKALNELEEKIAYYRKKLDALSLARNVLAHSTEELQTTFGPLINRRTQSYLEAMTGKQHGDLRISGEFDVSVYDSGHMDSHAAEDYSGATEDQIYLALRCALISLISADDAPLPLYLDDPFVQYDDDRFVRTARFIEQFSEETGAQILLATCQSRTAREFPGIVPITLEDNPS